MKNLKSRSLILIGLLAVALVATMPVQASQYPQGDTPGAQFVQTMNVPLTATADATIDYPVFLADRNVTILEVHLVPQAAITGTATNFKDIKALDKGTDGLGVTQIGATISLQNGTNMVALRKDGGLAGIGSTLAYNMAAGSVMSISLIKQGTGLATPAFQAVVVYRLQ
jgi:hypothetical protein